MSLNSGYSLAAFDFNLSHTKAGIKILLLDCKQHLIEGKKERIFELFILCRNVFKGLSFGIWCDLGWKSALRG